MFYSFKRPPQWLLDAMYKETITPILKCIPDNPYTSERHVEGARWEHSDIDEVPGSQKNGWPSGDRVTMKCNTCGITWEEELPQ